MICYSSSTATAVVLLVIRYDMISLSFYLSVRTAVQQYTPSIGGAAAVLDYDDTYSYKVHTDIGSSSLNSYFVLIICDRCLGRPNELFRVELRA